MTRSSRNTDIDNMVKFVFDALKGIIYYDDRDIISLTASKVQDQSNQHGITYICVERNVS